MATSVGTATIEPRKIRKCLRGRLASKQRCVLVEPTRTFRVHDECAGVVDRMRSEGG